jgi:ribosomal protein S27E
MLREYGPTDDLGYSEANPYMRDGWEMPDSDLTPVKCPGCDATMLECVHRHYVTYLRCPACKIKFVVHEG